jgi:mono/diheme cytochrome c family protein
MPEITSGRRALLIFAALAMILLPSLGASQTPARRVPAPYTSPISGSEMYREYCAACHGVSGKGNGPAAPALKTTPTDLTQLAARNGGVFPGA